jgi:sulfur-carrier protein
MRFVLSGNLLRFSSFQNEIDVDAPTIAEGLAKLCADRPLLQPVLFDAQGRFREVHRLFLNGDALGRDELDYAVNAVDEVTILTAIAGG